MMQDMWLQERREAYLSLDAEKIIEYMRKWSVRVPKDLDTFWASVHMARTGMKDLPMFERAASLRWLQQRGLRSMNSDKIEILINESPQYLERCAQIGCPYEKVVA